jgi:hypothetical protein
LIVASSCRLTSVAPWKVSTTGWSGIAVAGAIIVNVARLDRTVMVVEVAAAVVLELPRYPQSR